MYIFTNYYTKYFRLFHRYPEKGSISNPKGIQFQANDVLIFYE